MRMTVDERQGLHSYPEKGDYARHQRNSYDVSDSPGQYSKQQPMPVKHTPDVWSTHLAKH